MSALVADEVQLPEVQRTVEGEIRLTLSPKHARVLARILAHYDVLLTWTPTTLRRYMFEDPADTGAPALSSTRGYQPEVWQRTLIRLLAEEAQVSRPPARIVRVARGIPSNHPGAQR